MLTRFPAMAIKLTKTVVDRFKPGPKDEFHWDAEVKGFGARVTPKGKVTFVVQGRGEGSGKEARITIGAYGEFTVDTARIVDRDAQRSMHIGRGAWRESVGQDGVSYMV